VFGFLHTKTKTGIVDLGYLGFVHGFIASLAGVFLFRLFGLKAGIPVLLITAAWQTFYCFSYQQPKREWLSWLAGLSLAGSQSLD